MGGLWGAGAVVHRHQDWGLGTHGSVVGHRLRYQKLSACGLLVRAWREESQNLFGSIIALVIRMLRVAPVTMLLALAAVGCGASRADVQPQELGPNPTLPQVEAVGGAEVGNVTGDSGSGDAGVGEVVVDSPRQGTSTSTSSCAPKIEVQGFMLWAPHRVADCRPVQRVDGQIFGDLVFRTERNDDGALQGGQTEGRFVVSLAPLSAPGDRRTVLEFAIPNYLGGAWVSDVSAQGRMVLEYEGLFGQSPDDGALTFGEGIVVGRDRVEALLPFSYVLSAAFFDEHLIVSGKLREGSLGTFLVTESGDLSYLGPGQYVDLAVRGSLVFGRTDESQGRGGVLRDARRSYEQALHAWSVSQVRHAIEGRSELLEPDALTLYRGLSAGDGFTSSRTTHSYAYFNEGFVKTTETTFVGDASTKRMAHVTRLGVRDRRVEIESETPLFEHDVADANEIVLVDTTAGRLSLRSHGKTYGIAHR